MLYYIVKPFEVDRMNGADRKVGSCKFCEVVAGKLPSKKIFEDEIAFAFLDANPVFKGHSLLVTKKHCNSLYDLDDDITKRFFVDLKIVAKGVEIGTESDGTLIIENNNVSQSVQHLHFHIIPRMFGDGLRGFLWPRVKYKEGEAEAVSRSIRSEIERLLQGS